MIRWRDSEMRYNRCHPPHEREGTDAVQTANASFKKKAAPFSVTRKPPSSRGLIEALAFLSKDQACKFLLQEASGARPHQQTLSGAAAPGKWIFFLVLTLVYGWLPFQSLCFWGLLSKREQQPSTHEALVQNGEDWAGESHVCASIPSTVPIPFHRKTSDCWCPLWCSQTSLSHQPGLIEPLYTDHLQRVNSSSTLPVLEFPVGHLGREGSCAALSGMGHTLSLLSWWWWLHFVVWLFVLRHPPPVTQLGHKIRLKLWDFLFTLHSGV